MRLIDADALLSRLKQPTVEDINEVLRVEYDNAPNDVLAAEAVYNMYETVREAIKDAPTISPRDWTPCAEGLPLPKDGEPCYITVLKTEEDGRKHLYVVEGYFYSDKGIWFDRGGWKVNSKGVYPWSAEAIAWKLNVAPAPYNPRTQGGRRQEHGKGEKHE